MYKKTVTFEDFNGVERTQDFYFHISEAEMINKEATHSKDGWSDFIQKIVAEEDKGKIIEEFEWFISFAYGEKSDDGLQFRKSAELTEAFKQHPAYGDIFMSIMSSTEEQAAFVNQVFPRNVSRRMEDVAAKTGKSVSELSAEDIQKIAEDEQKAQEDKPKSE